MLPKFVPGGKNRGDAACMYVWSTRKQAHNVAGQEGWVYEPHLRCHNGMADHMKKIRQKAAAPEKITRIAASTTRSVRTKAGADDG